MRVSALWRELRAFLQDNYTFEPELHFGGKNYGWSYRHRRSGKTLCTLYPETGAFTVLVVMGKREIQEFEAASLSFNQGTRDAFARATLYPEGKWLYRRVLNASDLAGAKSLIAIKKRPGPRENMD